MIATGWGLNSTDPKTMPPILQEVTISAEECQVIFRYVRVIF